MLEILHTGILQLKSYKVAHFNEYWYILGLVHTYYIIMPPFSMRPVNNTNKKSINQIMQRKESNGRRREELPWALKKESKKKALKVRPDGTFLNQVGTSICGMDN